MLIELQAALTCLASIPHAMNHDEMLHSPSWSENFIVGLVYSVILFFYEVSEDNLIIFSKRNKRSLTQILTIHAAFITLLLCALRTCSYMIRYLPFWMTHEFDLGEGYMSIAEIIFLIGALALFAYEHQWLIITEDGSESVQE